MQPRPAALIAILIAALCAACASPTREGHAAPEAPDLRAHLAEQSRMQILRQRMRQVIRRVSAELPFACDAVIAGTADPRTVSDLLAVAAGGGTYSYARCATPDPRTGLADLIVTYTSIMAMFEQRSTLPGSGDMAPLLSVFRVALDELKTLGNESFPPEVLASVNAECKRVIDAEKTSLRGASQAGSMQAAIGSGPAEFQIQSTFLNFNDSGLVEHALGEAHLMRLSLQEVGDAMTQLPIALEYRTRRSILWAGTQPEIKDLRSDLTDMASEMRSLKELAVLRATALQQIESLPWKLGLALVAALAAQGVLLGFILRRR